MRLIRYYTELDERTDSLLSAGVMIFFVAIAAIVA